MRTQRLPPGRQPRSGRQTGTRTRSLRRVTPALFRLSYPPKKVERATRIELAHPGLEAPASSVELSPATWSPAWHRSQPAPLQGATVRLDGAWCPGPASNRQPPAYHAGARPLELPGQRWSPRRCSNPALMRTKQARRRLRFRGVVGDRRDPGDSPLRTRSEEQDGAASGSRTRPIRPWHGRRSPAISWLRNGRGGRA